MERFWKKKNSLGKLFFSKKKPKERKKAPPEISILALLFITYLVSIYIFHANAAGAEAYSSPSIILCNEYQKLIFSKQS